jgi:hypothetical protein
LTGKSDALIRDIAKLVVKYDLSDWAIVIEMFKTGSPVHHAIAAAIEDACKIGSFRSATSGAVRTARYMPPLESLSQERAEALERLSSDIEARRIIPSMAAVRAAFLAAGGKQRLPEKRPQAVKMLLNHLARISDESFQASLRAIVAKETDLQHEYTKWFDMIYNADRQGISRKPLVGEIVDLKKAEEIFTSRGLTVARPAQNAGGKTPDFEVRRNGVLVAYGEVKSPQRDGWLEKTLHKAPPGTIVGGGRPDPTFNRISSHVHTAAAQFRAVNPDHTVLNILIFVNHDSHSHYGDLLETVTGNFYAADGSRHPTMKHISEGRIQTEKYGIDAYIWYDVESDRVQGYLINEVDADRVDAICSLLAVDKSKIKR